VRSGALLVAAATLIACGGGEDVEVSGDFVYDQYTTGDILLTEDTAFNRTGRQARMHDPSCPIPPGQ
jgi:hypothetical protein